eukprot:159466-Rhodomonas_salina.5
MENRDTRWKQILLKRKQLTRGEKRKENIISSIRKTVNRQAREVQKKKEREREVNESNRGVHSKKGREFLKQFITIKQE